MEGPYEFAVRVANLVDAGESDEALNAILDDDSDTLVQEASLELIALVGARLSDGRLQREDANAAAALSSILEYITKFCKPKEVLVGLLDLLESVRSDAAFELFTAQLKVAFVRLPHHRDGSSFGWALDQLRRYLDELPPPPEHLLEDDETAILENCDASTRLLTCTRAALRFCAPFVSEVRSCVHILSADERVQRASVLTKFLLSLIGYPIGRFHVRDPTTAKFASDFTGCAEQAVALFNRLCPASFWSLPEATSELGTAQEPDAAPVGRAVLAYLVFAERIGAGRLPTVYSNAFVCERVLPSAVVLMRRSSCALARKGVRLAGHLVSLLPRSCRSSSRVAEQQDTFLALIAVAQQFPLKSIRREALQTFDRLVQSFVVAAQLAVVRMLFDRLQSAGDADAPLGLLVDVYRRGVGAAKGRAYMDELEPMLRLFCQLPDGESAILLDHFTRLTAVLNLLRAAKLAALPLPSWLDGDFVEPLRLLLCQSRSEIKADAVAVQRLPAAQRKLPENLQRSAFSEVALTNLDLLAHLLACFDGA